MSNADEDDEDEAIIQVRNWGCSVSQTGWIHEQSGSKSASVWAASDMETFTIWTSEVSLLFLVLQNNNAFYDLKSCSALTFDRQLCIINKHGSQIIS